MSINWKKKKFLPNTFQNPYHPAFTCVKESNQYFYQSIYTTQIATSRFTHADVANTQPWKLHDSGFLSGRGGSGETLIESTKGVAAATGRSGPTCCYLLCCGPRGFAAEVTTARWDCWEQVRLLRPSVWVCMRVSVHVCECARVCVAPVWSGGERLLKSSVDKGR